MYQGTCWHERTTQLLKLVISFNCVDVGAQIQLVGLGSKCHNPSSGPNFRYILNGWMNEKIVRAGIYILFSNFILP